MKRIHLLLCAFMALPCAIGCDRNAAPIPETAIHGIIVSGDTLGASLAGQGLTPAAQREIIDALSRVFDLRTCRGGDRYDILLATRTEWSRFTYTPAGMSLYVVIKSSDNRCDARKIAKNGARQRTTYQGTIRTSLWESMREAHVNPEQILAFSDIFSWQIDFLTEPRAGDRYRMIVDEYRADDGTVLDATIIAAQYLAAGKTYSGMLFTTRDGNTDYYAVDGSSLRSAFLRAPLQYRRISSFFTLRRFHPVLKYFRPHLGIDYAAPSGTPVSSIGDGMVRYAGWKGGFGRYIAIMHHSGYASYYGHLRGFARGIAAGQRVRQGQLIGYVGTSGLSTGPHLDFRMTLNGKFINFLTVKIAASRSVPGKERDAFKLRSRDMLTALASIR